MNSPLMTAVVGTSTAAAPPKAPLTPAIATTMASPATEAMIVRFLLRHMTLHRHARLEAGRDNDLVIVHRTKRDRVRTFAAAIQDAHRKGVVLAHDCVAGYDDDVVFPLELDVNRGRQIRQQLRVASLDADGRDEVAHTRRQHAGRADRVHVLDAPGEVEVWIGVEGDPRRLTGLQEVHVRLVDFHPREHRIGVDDLHDRHAGPRLLALLDLELLIRAPYHAQHDHARDWRRDGHPRGVIFGRLHRLVGAIPLDLEDAHVCLLGPALQIECRNQLFVLRFCLFEALLVLFLIDAAEIGVLLDLEACIFNGTRRDEQLSLVLRARLFLLRALLSNLLFEIAEFRAPVGGSFQLILTVEFDEEVSWRDARAARPEPGDDECVAAWPRGADKTGSRDVVKADRFDEASQPQRFHDRATRDFDRSRWGFLRRFAFWACSADAAHNGEYPDEARQNERQEQIWLLHRGT